MKLLAILILLNIFVSEAHAGVCKSIFAPSASVESHLKIGSWMQMKDPKQSIQLSRDMPTFDNDKSLSRFVTKEGDLVLFRVLSQPYDKNRAIPSPDFAYSYTLAPGLFGPHLAEILPYLHPTTIPIGVEKIDVASMRKYTREFIRLTGVQPQVLIAIQNIYRDNLWTIWNMDAQNKPLPLDLENPNLRINYELNVPPANENVVATVPFLKFDEILQSQASSFDLNTLLQALLPFAHRP
jgi:hypothetical protein